MKFYFLAIVALAFTLNSCGQNLLQTSSETLGSYNVDNSTFYINISKVNGGATSSDFMQIRRVYNDSTYEVVKNIRNRDSIVVFSYKLDTINLIVRGRNWDKYSTKNDTIKFSIKDIFIQGRYKIGN